MWWHRTPADEGYLLVLKVHVLPSGEGRVEYRGDLTLAPKVLAKLKTVLSNELNIHGLSISTKGNIQVTGVQDKGVLSQAQIREEEEFDTDD